VTSRKNHRADMLLRHRRREEQAARRAFQEARGLADAAERRVAGLRALLAEQNDAARRELLAGAGRASRTYPAIAGELLAEIGRQQADLQRHDGMLRRRRGRLAETITRRKAAEIVRRKLAARRSARLARAEVQQSADVHASRSAGGESDAT